MHASPSICFHHNHTKSRATHASPLLGSETAARDGVVAQVIDSLEKPESRFQCSLVVSADSHGAAPPTSQ